MRGSRRQSAAGAMPARRARHLFRFVSRPWLVRRTAVDNLAIARILTEIGDLLEISAENPFKIRAYRNAAETIVHETRRVAEMSAGERLSLPAVGKDISAKIGELLDTGSIRYHQDLLERFPPTVLDLLHLHGVGPKTVALLYREVRV